MFGVVRMAKSSEKHIVCTKDPSYALKSHTSYACHHHTLEVTNSLLATLQKHSSHFTKSHPNPYLHYFFLQSITVLIYGLG